jgi:hypothetical protein
VLEGINKKLILIVLNPLIGCNSFQMKTQRKMKATPFKLLPKTVKTHPQKNQPHLYANHNQSSQKMAKFFKMVVISAHDL